MRTTATSNKRNSSSSSVEAAGGQHQRKSAKGSSSTAAAVQQHEASSSGAGEGSDQQQHNHHQHNHQQQLQQHYHAKSQEDEARKGGGGKTKQRHHQVRHDDVEEEAQHRHRQRQKQKQQQLQRVNQTTVAAVGGGGEENRKQNHCEIEKRRRDKMNHYIMELASIIPSFNNNQGKFDKLTVLRMAVQHVKSLRSSLCSFSSFHLRPSFLSSGNLLKNLILQMASQESQDNLFMVVTCDRGKVLFVSESSKDILNQNQQELVGQCLFDILHKDDVTKVKEQISHFNMMPKEMLVDSKTLQPIKHNQRQSFNLLQNQQPNSTPQPGARRSFFCRMRGGRNNPQAVNNENISSSSPSPSSSSSENLQAAKQTSSAEDDAADEDDEEVEEEDEEVGDEDDSNERLGDGGGLATTIEQRQRSMAVKDGSSYQHSKQIAAAINANNHNSRSSGLSQLEADANVKTSSAVSSSAPSQIGPPSGSNNNNDTTDMKVKINKSSSNNNNNNNNNISNTNDKSKISNNKMNNKSKSKNRGNSPSSDSSSGNSTGGSSSTAGNKTRSCNSGSSRSSSSGIISGSQASEQSPCDGSTSPPSAKKGATRRNTKRVNQTKTSGANGSYGATGASNGGAGSGNSKKHSRYIVMHCTGYLKSITLRNDEFDDDDDDDFDDYNGENNSSDDEENDDYRTVDCFVAVCRRSPMDRDLKPDRPLTFTCRYSMEGKFVFVDQRTTVALGYTPQQILGTSHYAYCHKDSVKTFKECHRQSILKSESVSSDIYQFKRANGQHLWLQTSLKSFRNPWTKFIDYIVANHTTAEGNDPHYNEGFVPTKFNQDMTCEGSQSSSPASSSSLSLPSMDSKKSSSPSSSSIGSSYSMDSYASGASIQALLNQIDRVKSGGIKHALDLHKKRGEGHLVRSSVRSTRKSNEDSGTYSDPQSCSPLSSQNSAQSTEYVNAPAINYFGDGGNNQAPATGINNTIANTNYYNQKLNAFRPAQGFCAPPNYQPACQQQQHQQIQQQQPQQQQLQHQQSQHQLQQQSAQQQTQQQQQQQQQFVSSNAGNIVEPPRFESSMPCQIGIRGTKTGLKIAGKIVRRQVCPNKQQQQQQQPQPQRIYSNHSYHYRNQNKSSSSNSSETSSGIESTGWNSSGSSVYSNSSSLQPTRQEVDQAAGLRNQMTTVIEDRSSSGPCGVQLQTQSCQSIDKMVPYVSMQPVETAPMNIVTAQVATFNQMGGIEPQVDESYAGNMMPRTAYVSQDVNSRYNDGMNLNTAITQQQQQQLNNDLQANMTMTMQQQQHQNQVQRPQQQTAANPNEMNVPIMWNTTGNPCQNLNNTMHNNEAQQICTSGDATIMNMDVGNSNNQMLNQSQTVQCQQCANHKCLIQQLMMTNNTDLNSINLTSLAVDGDLDEDQLLEYLAGCEPETQLYHIQNNAFPQYNIYK